MNELKWIVECSAFSVMLGISVVIGLYFGCVKKEGNTVNEYLLGNKKMTVFPIVMSLIASHISGIMLLGIPTEVYCYGTLYLLSGAINMVIIIVIFYVYLPVFYELQLTSVYEYLEYRFNSTIRGFASIIYAVSLILYIPIVMYVPALVLNQITGISVHLITPLICVICIFYTTIGGLKAVVWTDAIQSFFTALSVIVIIVMALVEVGGFGNMIRTNLVGDRIEFFKMDPDPFLRNSFWTVSIGTALHVISTIGVQAGSVQRFVSLPSYAKAGKSLIAFSLGMCVVKILTGCLGMLIYTKYQDCDPVLADYIKSYKYILPYFVVDIVGLVPGLTGLFISGMFSAALSTMSAHLNTVSGTIYKDFIVKVISKDVSESTASIIMKCVVVIVGSMCLMLVVVVEKFNEIIQFAKSMSGITDGAIVSVFTLGLCFPCCNSRGVICGMITSIGVMAWIITGAQLATMNNELKLVMKNVSIAGCPTNITFKNHNDFSGLYRMNDDVYVSPNVLKIFTVSYLHYNTVGTIIGIVVGLVVSVLFPMDQNIDPKLITPCVRKFLYPKYAVAKGNRSGYVTRSEEYRPVTQNTKL
ncbi:Sodium/solute symporter [Cinara cedri]|uniref:Sodium/solute symporter n=1 Tax=Cinara cedri TaxID=506608 RepID=A0A5E4N9V3_9HEMI|nr:Sodium/solute symporter [Cinara cedri]